MLTNVTISNFKLHNHTELKLSGLNILTGINGVGKSSVIQSLLLLRQSLFSNTLDMGLSLNGDLFDAGTSDEVFYQLSKENEMRLDLKFDEQEDLSYVFKEAEKSNMTLLPGVSENVTSKEKLRQYSLFNENFQYLSAFRFGPQKTYEISTESVVNRNQISGKWGKCEYVIHYLQHYGKNDIPIKELAIDFEDDVIAEHRLSHQTERWLRIISPNIKIRLESSSNDIRLKYNFNRTGNLSIDEISAINTGFGVTYVLPILVAILSAKKGALIIIENPEAHIHPAGQAALMKLISKAVANGVQIIVETHSDHIVNGALVAVKQKTISPEQLSIYYFARNEEQHVAETYPLNVSPTGRIKNPPKGFFDQIDIDLNMLIGF